MDHLLNGDIDFSTKIKVIRFKQKIGTFLEGLFWIRICINPSYSDDEKLDNLWKINFFN